MSDITWTPEEMADFDRLTEGVSSRNQMARIEARLDLMRFVRDVGEEKCQAMYAHLKKSDGK